MNILTPRVGKMYRPKQGGYGSFMIVEVEERILGGHYFGYHITYLKQ